MADPVDVAGTAIDGGLLDRGRSRGSYAYQLDVATTTSIWNRRADDGGTGHEDPVVG